MIPIFCATGAGSKSRSPAASGSDDKDDDGGGGSDGDDDGSATRDGECWSVLAATGGSCDVGLLVRAGGPRDGAAAAAAAISAGSVRAGEISAVERFNPGSELVPMTDP